MSKYPYEQWINGQINLLKAPGDYLPGTERKVRSAVSSAARRHDWKVVCRTLVSPDGRRDLVIWGDKNISRLSPVPEEVKTRLGMTGAGSN